MVDKTTIVGAGIIGTMEAWYALEAAKHEGRDLIVRILDQYTENNSTSINIVPSLTLLEMLAVIPPIDQFEHLLTIPFNQSGIHPGLPGITDREMAKKFIAAVSAFSTNSLDQEARIKALLNLGQIAMELWQKFYDDAQPELKNILEQSGFHPCREPRQNETVLRDGYRIDLIEKETAVQEANEIISIHQQYGFKHSKQLTPAEVKRLDPLLSDYCAQNALNDHEWKPGITALWRPGGCINTRKFIPLFHQYMEKRFGTWTDSKGKTRNRFAIKYGKQVDGVAFDNAKTPTAVTGLQIGSTVKQDKNPDYQSKSYTFCPGEEVGLLSRFGLDEPAYASFAGAVLFLELPIPNDQIDIYKNRQHGMEVHQDGVVLAWQGRYENKNGEHKLILGMGGTKAFYADVMPTTNDPFLKNRNLLQLNAANHKFYRSISLLLGRNTQGEILQQKDLDFLVQKGWAKPYVGRRANSATGMPCVGPVSYKGMMLNNARVNTYWSSGGVSYAHVAAQMNQNPQDPKYAEGLKWTNPRLQPTKAKL